MLRNTLRFIRYFSHRDRRMLVVVIVLSMFQAAIEAAAVALIPLFIASLQSPELVMKSATGAKVLGALGVESAKGLVVASSVVLLVTFILRTVFGILVLRLQLRYSERVQMMMAHKLLLAFMFRPYEYHLHRNSSDMVRAIVGELAAVFTFLVTPMFTVVTELLTAALVVALLFSVEPAIAAVTVVFFGAASFIFYRTIRTRIAHFGHANQFHSRESLKWLNQSLVGIKEAKLYGREAFFANRFREHASASSRASNNNGMMAQLPKYFNEMLAVAAMVGLALVLTAYNDKSVLATLVLFAVAAMRVIPSFNRLVAIYTGVRFAGPVVESVLRDLEGIEADAGPAPAAAGAAGADDGVEPFSELRIEGLTYAYPTGAFRLQVEQLSIRRGQRVAFVGSSGSGKTTLIDVLTGLLTPSGGEITINGKEVDTVRQRWKRSIGYIPQSVYLIDDSLRANVAFGLAAEDVDEDRLGDVIKAAQMEAFVESLAEGRDAMTGDRGIRLSGGQRQRIGIARALYQQPEVLILDEGTSALDNVTEAQVVNAINSLGREKTIIIIAHRLSTVESCDVIHVMKHGRIVASGTFEALSRESADFKEMLRPSAAAGDIGDDH